MRVIKIAEELGEVSEAVVGATGGSPRKGLSHTWADLERELCDVILTAMIALRTLTPDAHAAFAQHLDTVAARDLNP
ncbi:hypothetical protein G3I60_05235 [Streptomyces sp. SID13666]|nr:hypothetical protein [Streptomyces sp. SID13666]